MKAVVIGRYKEQPHVADVAEPVVGDGDVLIRVAAAGLNPLDQGIVMGAFAQILRYRLPVILGNEFAGTVVQVGAQVSGFRPGDRVYSRPDARRIGAFAERIAVGEDDLALVPSSISMEEAASLPLAALTAWQALVERARVRPGQKVLIHGGAGGFGSIAIQLAKDLGAEVAATASSSNLDFVRGLGADTVVDYRAQDFSQVLHGYDLVIDSVGGENLEKSLRILKPGGMAIGIAGPPDPAFARDMELNPVVRVAIGRLSSRVRRQAKSLGVTYGFLFMRASGEQLSRITALVEAGAIRPIVGKTVPFDEIPDALAALERGGTRGKVVATISSTISSTEH